MGFKFETRMKSSDRNNLDYGVLKEQFRFNSPEPAEPAHMA
jgi:hypothetical protein